MFSKSNSWQPQVVRQLRSICGKTSVFTDRATLKTYECDALQFNRHMPDCVVVPGGVDQLKEIVRLCRGKDFPYVIRGAGTSLSGGPLAVEGGLVIHLSRLNQILEINEEDFYCVVEPGVVLNRLTEQLQPLGLFYPPDPSSGFACTLGGNVAENSGGIRCFKHGPTANYVLGVEMILPDGEIVRFGGPAGGRGGQSLADWKRVMVGSEGLLGTILKIWLRLLPLPESTRTLVAHFLSLDDAVRSIVELVRSPRTPLAIELIDNKVVRLIESSPMALGMDQNSMVLLAEIEGPEILVERGAQEFEEIMKKNNALSIRTTGDEKEREDLWKARKIAGGLMGQISPDNMVQDAVIPRSHIGDVLNALYREGEKENIPVLNVFHAGDGNLHPNFLFDSRDPEQVRKVKRLGKFLMEKVISLGGTLSGEHGIGNDKMDYVPVFFGKREISLQEILLGCFNPNHQMNPGKVFPNRSYTGCCAPAKR